jgi:large subunit ribosomal protein L35
VPKLKTRKAAAKRYKVTGSGKIMRRKAGKNHMLEHKTTTQKTRLSQMAEVSERDAGSILRMMPYA